MPTTSWKSWELRLARLLGGERRGAHYGDRRGGFSDIKGLGWARVEAKLKARFSWCDIESALKQVEVAQDETAAPDALPFAVLKRNGRGRLDLDAVVVIRLRDFLCFLRSPHPALVPPEVASASRRASVAADRSAEE